MENGLEGIWLGLNPAVNEDIQTQWQNHDDDHEAQCATPQHLLARLAPLVGGAADPRAGRYTPD